MGSAHSPLTVDLLQGVMPDGRFNITSGSRNANSRLLSNFAARPFRYGETMMASVEGFIQGIKYPYRHEGRERAFAASGPYAKSLSPSDSQPYVWWSGAKIVYGTQQHHEVIAGAIRAKFEQNPDCRNALMATGTRTLMHDTGTPESPHTSLPAHVFCGILKHLRREFRT
jgi:predicted NAD-dependent protein-ADP-ribosyltransferase YbiA (DUF1768 family)